MSKRKGKELVNKTKRPKIKSFNEMDDREFNEFLQGKIITDFVTTSDKLPDKLTSTDLKIVAADLEKAYGQVKAGDVKSLQDHVKLGEMFTEAFSIFESDKIKRKVIEAASKKSKKKDKGKTISKKDNKDKKDTWAEWVKMNTSISEAYVRQHREIAALTSEYPKLKRLAETYTELYKMKNRIIQCFATNIDIGNWWKEN